MLLQFLIVITLFDPPSPLIVLNKSWKFFSEGAWKENQNSNSSNCSREIWIRLSKIGLTEGLTYEISSAKSNACPSIWPMYVSINCRMDGWDSIHLSSQLIDLLRYLFIFQWSEILGIVVHPFLVSSIKWDIKSYEWWGQCLKESSYQIVFGLLHPLLLADGKEHCKWFWNS